MLAFHIMVNIWKKNEIRETQCKKDQCKTLCKRKNVFFKSLA